MKRRALPALFFLLIFSFSVSALYCSEGDRGGKLLGFTVECFGSGEVTIYCSNGSSRGQCFERESCDVENYCLVGDDEEYGVGCRADCGDEITFVGITCKPSPITAPSVNLSLQEYSGFVGKEFTIQGFGADAQLIKDIFFEPVEGCDLNQVKSGLGTASASVTTYFSCSQDFSARDIVLFAEDYCGAESRANAKLSVSNECLKECIPRLYPQCQNSEYLECIEDGDCTTLIRTPCEHGCLQGECCQPLGCLGLGFDCGETKNNCDENVSCGECQTGFRCQENKCIPEIIPPQLPLLDMPQPLADNTNLALFGGVAVIAIVVIVVFLKSRQ